MDKYITIEHPYQKIVLDFSTCPAPAEPPLHSRLWDQLVKAEERLYRGEYGQHGWTDVMPNDGDALLNRVWAQAYEAADNTVESSLRIHVEREAARRTAAALAVLSFGTEFLLK